MNKQRKSRYTKTSSNPEKDMTSMSQVRSQRMRSVATTSESVVSVNTDKEFESFLVNNPCVCVKYSAEWCMPCKQVEPWFRDLSSKYRNVRFCLVDIDEAEGEEFIEDIESVPTFRIYAKSKKVNQYEGVDEVNMTSIEKDLSTMSSSVGRGRSRQGTIQNDLSRFIKGNK